MTNEVVKLLVCLSPAIILLLSLAAWGFSAFGEYCKKMWARKHQLVLFGNLRRGDYIWLVYGDHITEYKILDAEYIYNRACTVDYLLLRYGGYDTLRIELKDFKRCVYTERLERHFYTIYDEAKATANLVAIQRNAELKKATAFTQEDLTSEVNRAYRELKKLADETSEKIKIKLEE